VIRGSTPTHTFTAPCNGENIAKVNILYAQDDVFLFKKKTSDCNIQGSTISVKLTREESLLFNHRKPAQVQAVIQLTTGDILESLVETIGVDKLLDDGVIE
jgi:hypothetical protein